jgi:hypothetical protein
MYHKNPMPDNMGNWAIVDEQNRLRFMVYSTASTPETIHSAEIQADVIVAHFNWVEFGVQFPSNGKSLQITELSGVELAQILGVAETHFFIPAGWKNGAGQVNEKSHFICACHDKIIDPIVEPDAKFLLCPRCVRRVPFVSVEDLPPVKEPLADLDKVAEIFRQNAVNKPLAVGDTVKIVRLGIGGVEGMREYVGQAHKILKANNKVDEYELEGCVTTWGGNNYWVWGADSLQRVDPPVANKPEVKE